MSHSNPPHHSLHHTSPQSPYSSGDFTPAMIRKMFPTQSTTRAQEVCDFILAHQSWSAVQTFEHLLAAGYTQEEINEGTSLFINLPF